MPSLLKTLIVPLSTESNILYTTPLNTSTILYSFRVVNNTDIDTYLYTLVKSGNLFTYYDRSTLIKGTDKVPYLGGKIKLEVGDYLRCFISDTPISSTLWDSSTEEDWDNITWWDDLISNSDNLNCTLIIDYLERT
mgnify:CR=1 FL=1